MEAREMYPTDFNSLIHHLRTDQLRRTGPENGVMISVGCSDRIYFDWVHENLGVPAKHIALEFYREKPAGLPAAVEWIPNTAGDMGDVGNECADLMFAGQVVEHLWPEELAAFFFEAARVLKAGGRLVVDSPNEEIVRATGWHHPEHTIEFRPVDARTLLDLAGFRVTKMVGHWLCRSSEGDILPLVDLRVEGPWPIERRVNEGLDHPGDCFSWWIEGRKERPPNAAAVMRFVGDLWQRYGDRRIQCSVLSSAPEQTFVDGVRVAIAPLGWEGWLLFGPYAPLPPGRTLIGFTLDPYFATESPGRIEIFRAENNQILAEAMLPPVKWNRDQVWLEVNLPATTFGLEFRLWTTGAAQLTARVGIDLARIAQF
jgi:SAM-dependent methyltransferase